MTPRRRLSVAVLLLALVSFGLATGAAAEPGKKRLKFLRLALEALPEGYSSSRKE